MTTRPDWLHRLPPWRFPIPGRGRRYRHHAHFGDVVAACFVAFGWLFILEFGAALWLAEFQVWLMVWFYYGMFLGARQVYRANLIGRVVGVLTGGRRGSAAALDSYAAPVDLARMDDGDRPMRRRR